MSKTIPTSSKHRLNKKKITLSDGTEVKTENHSKSAIRRGKISKHVNPKKPFSTETGKTNDDWEVKDDYDSLEYPPPSKHPYFRKLWAETITNITSRENFKTAHLTLFETLCRMQVELRALDNFIMENGHVFRIVTVLGEQRKTYPEVSQRNIVLGMIAKYSQLLDLVPKKDNGKGSGTKKEIEEWG